MQTKFSSENLKERDHSEDLVVDDKIISIRILRIEGWEFWTGSIWLKIGTSGRELL
jgi:hypothetical protein